MVSGFLGLEELGEIVVANCRGPSQAEADKGFGPVWCGAVKLDVTSDDVVESINWCRAGDARVVDDLQ